MKKTKNKKSNGALKGLLTLGFLLQAPNPVLADSGWHEEAFPTTISYANMSSKERNEAGFLAALNSEKLSGNKSWNYDIKEAGDYQLATSWIEVLSKGEVKVTMSINGEIVKTLKAADGTVIIKGKTLLEFGITRIESRFEGLKAGDRLEIKTEASGEVNYRLAYHLVNTTPNFDGLKVLNVSDFGAKGDGKHDDMAAIHKAVNATKEAGGGIIRFDKEKHYRLIGSDKLEYEAVFDLVETANIKIEGQGSTLILHPPDGLANIRQSRNIQIDGLLIDYAPLPYYQGKITNIDVKNMTIDIKVPERYPAPLTGVNQYHAPFFGRSFIPDKPGSRTGKGENIYVESTKTLSSPRHIRIQVPKTAKGSDSPNAAMLKRVINAKEKGATEFVVPHLKYGHRDGWTNTMQSARIKYSNLRYYLVPYFWMRVKGNVGPVTFQNVDMKMKNPETELLASWRDGFHIKNGRFGTLLDSCDIDGSAQYDDSFAIYTRIHKVAKVDQVKNKLTLDAAFRNHKDLHTWLKGDWVSIWNKDQSVLRGMARLEQLKNLPKEYKRFYIFLENLPEDIQADDIVINEEVLNRGTLVRNCSNSAVGTETASNRFRASGIRFENNHFEDFQFLIEFNSFWATPRSRNVEVVNTFIGGGESYANLYSPMAVTFNNCQFDGITFTGKRNAKNILLKDIKWTNSEKLVKADPYAEIYLKGNIKADDKKLSDQELAKRSSVNKDSLIQFPNGKELKQSPPVKKSKHPKPELN